MSSYRNQISCCVSDQVAADLSTMATSREITVAALVRQAIVRELYTRKDPTAEIFRHVVFVAIAVDFLLDRLTDTELRSRVIELWRDRMAKEGQHDGD